MSTMKACSSEMTIDGLLITDCDGNTVLQKSDGSTDIVITWNM